MYVCADLCAAQQPTLSFECLTYRDPKVTESPDLATLVIRNSLTEVYRKDVMSQHDLQY